MDTTSFLSMESQVPLEQLTYEQAMAELESIVAALEAEERSLEEALALFERGQTLVRHCTDMLDKADLKVQQLSGEELVSFVQEQ